MKVRIPQGPSRAELLEKVQKMQDDATALQADLDAREYTATAGGMVTVKVTGAHEVVSVEINEECLSDKEMTEDLITVALNEAINKAKTESATEMENLQSGLNIPGMPGLF